MISVIIPLYNKEKIVERTLRSVLYQDYDDFEVVIVDDGSTDGSLAVVEREYPKIESEMGVNVPVNIIKQENGGPSKARNTGVKNASGEWIYFIDADDSMEPGALSHFSKLILEHPNIDMFLSEVYNYDGENKVIRKNYRCREIKNIFKEHFFCNIVQCTGSSLYKRSICINELYDESLRRYEDFEWLFRHYRTYSLYVSNFPVATINVQYVSASKSRKDISDDFVGHLQFEGKGFWEKMCLYKLFLGERSYYAIQCKELYPFLYRRFDLYFIYQILVRFPSWLLAI